MGYEKGVVKLLTPVRAIRERCMDCCCWQWAEVQRCPAKDCPLHGYRLGHRPQKTFYKSHIGQRRGFYVLNEKEVLEYQSKKKHQPKGVFAGTRRKKGGI